MPTRPLPENASLDHLNGQAKLVRDLIRFADDGALSMINESTPASTLRTLRGVLVAAGLFSNRQPEAHMSHVLSRDESLNGAPQTDIS